MLHACVPVLHPQSTAPCSLLQPLHHLLPGSHTCSVFLREGHLQLGPHGEARLVSRPLIRSHPRSRSCYKRTHSQVPGVSRWTSLGAAIQPTIRHLMVLLETVILKRFHGSHCRECGTTAQGCPSSPSPLMDEREVRARGSRQGHVTGAKRHGEAGVGKMGSEAVLSEAFAAMLLNYLEHAFLIGLCLRRGLCSQL